MAIHRICLTVDTDPDGLNARLRNRSCLSWNGLERLQKACDSEPLSLNGQDLPLTWFIRLDGQLEQALGAPEYLWVTYSGFWNGVKRRGHELAWHPHLYRCCSTHVPELILDAAEALEELERLWQYQSQTPAGGGAFRNGEGWMTAGMLDMLESLGFSVDSSAIPGRTGPAGHPMRWRGAPNRPYYPSQGSVCSPGPSRRILEVPMTTWRLRAPYDARSKIRYMNPAVHGYLFQNALARWTGLHENEDTLLWTFVFHPDEVMGGQPPNPLFAHSWSELSANLGRFVDALVEAGHVCSFHTVSEAAILWRKEHDA